uniref:Uncharacterized protein n=1 Tax=Romanomermis culicivorax TaxID=13658 RepID=A0A915J094_ROMCU
MRRPRQMLTIITIYGYKPPVLRGFCISKYKAVRAFVFSLSKIGPSDSDCALNEIVGLKGPTVANDGTIDGKVPKLDLPPNYAGDGRTTASAENSDGTSIRRTNSRTVLDLVHQVKQKFSVSVESTKSSSFCETEYRKVHIDDCLYPMIEYMEKILEFGYIVTIQNYRLITFYYKLTGSRVATTKQDKSQRRQSKRIGDFGL